MGNGSSWSIVRETDNSFTIRIKQCRNEEKAEIIYLIREKADELQSYCFLFFTYGVYVDFQMGIC